MLDNIPSTLSKITTSHFYIAYSGGLDSTVLLHLLAHSSLKNKLTALHINHQLSPNAQQWQEHCQHVCEQLGVPLISEAVAVSGNDGVEANARKARYQVFEEVVKKGECLLTAHHQDDQVETLLYRLFRGAGPEGLAAMPPQRALGQGILLRPLLRVTREELELYAQEHKLSWIEDESNSNTDFDRNFIRHELLPLIEKRWPGSGNCVARAASLCREQAVLNQSMGTALTAKLGLRQEKLGSSIDGEVLEKLPPEQQSLVLRQWCRDQMGTVPEAKQLALVLPQVWQAFDDARPCLKVGNSEIRRFQKRLFLIPILPIVDEKKSIGWLCGESEQGTLLLPDGSQLTLPKSTVFTDSFALSVNYQRSGIRCKPCGRSHSQKLKKLLQESNVPPWLRDRIPLIYLDDILVAVGDLWLTQQSLEQAPFLHCNNDDHFSWVFPKAVQV